jgi:CBS domain-containing protein
MKAKDVMTSPVASLEPDATVLQAVHMMLQKRISGLPVIDKDGRLVGIVTEGDFLRRSETGTEQRRSRWLELLVGAGRLADEYTRAHGRKVKEVMTRDPTTASEDTPLGEIVDLMERHQIKRIPIVRGDHVVGIVSRANLLHALASASQQAALPTQSDETIRTLLLTEFGKQRWAQTALMYVNPIVRNGVLDLWGTITDERERQALIVAAQNVPGVKELRDHLVLIDPIFGTVISESQKNRNLADTRKGRP